MEKGYQPDIVVERNNKKIIIEVERYSPPGKILEDIIFSSIAGAAQLVVIFSNENEEGEKRKVEAERLYQIFKSRFGSPLTRLVEPKIDFVNSESDKKIGEICSEILRWTQYVI